MPMRLDPGWNQIIFNLADYVKRAYGTNYSETSRVTVHANCRIRRIYFTDRLYSEDELPAEFKLFLPVSVILVGNGQTSKFENCWYRLIRYKTGSDDKNKKRRRLY
jgi:hypothetical protein